LEKDRQVLSQHTKKCTGAVLPKIEKSGRGGKGLLLAKANVSGWV